MGQRPRSDLELLHDIFVLLHVDEDGEYCEDGVELNSCADFVDDLNLVLEHRIPRFAQERQTGRYEYTVVGTYGSDAGRSASFVDHVSALDPAEAAELSLKARSDDGDEPTIVAVFRGQHYDE